MERRLTILHILSIPVQEVFLHWEKTGLTGMSRMDRIGERNNSPVRPPAAAKLEIRSTKSETRRRDEGNMKKILTEFREIVESSTDSPLLGHPSSPLCFSAARFS